MTTFSPRMACILDLSSKHVGFLLWCQITDACGAFTLSFTFCDAVQDEGIRFLPQGGNALASWAAVLSIILFQAFITSHLNFGCSLPPFMLSLLCPYSGPPYLPMPHFLKTLIPTWSFLWSFNVNPLQGPGAAGSWLPFPTHLRLLLLPVLCSSLSSSRSPLGSPWHAILPSQSVLPLPYLLPGFLPILSS